MISSRDGQAPSLRTWRAARLDAFRAARRAEIVRTEDAVPLREFVRDAWPWVEPEHDLVWAPYLDVMCGVLERVSAGEIKRVIFNVPPGSMKSLLISVMWPAWEWSVNPRVRILAASYGGDLSTRDCLRMRDIVTSTWYRDRFPHVRIEPGQRRKTRFNTTAQGWRIGTSVGGVGTGEHPDVIIVDDPTSAEQAESESRKWLDRANRWFDTTLSTRGLVRDVRIVVIMQRLNENDLTAHLLEGKHADEYHHVCLPLWYEPDRPDAYPDDPRTVEGESLSDELFSEERLRPVVLRLGELNVAGQLQQRPAPPGGTLFKRAWFERVDAAPADARRCRGWDTAGTEGGGDWTVGVRMAEAGGVWYVEDVVRVQYGATAVEDLILQTAAIDGKDVAVREEREGGSSGPAVIASRTRAMAGYDYAGVALSKSKMARARAFRSQCEARNVKIVRGEWNAAYLAELETFPVGQHMDQVDATSCAFNAMVVEGLKPVRRVGTWGRRGTGLRVRR